jgi:hypothetical protein
MANWKVIEVVIASHAFTRQITKRVQDRYNLSVPSLLLRALGSPTVPQNQRVTLVIPDFQSEGRGFESLHPCHSF